MAYLGLSLCKVDILNYLLLQLYMTITRVNNFFKGALGQFEWMSAPPAPMGCPPGLEYLLAVDQILIHQMVELLEGEKYLPSLGVVSLIQRLAIEQSTFKP